MKARERFSLGVLGLDSNISEDLAKKPRTKPPKFWLRSNLLRVLEKTDDFLWNLT